jgi:hypothetical protein
MRFALVILGIGFVRVMTNGDVVDPPPRYSPPELLATILEVQTAWVTFVNTAGLVVIVILPLVLIPVATGGRSEQEKLGFPVAVILWFVVSPKIQVNAFVSNAGGPFTQTIRTKASAVTPVFVSVARIVFVKAESVRSIATAAEVPPRELVTTSSPAKAPPETFVIDWGEYPGV